MDLILLTTKTLFSYVSLYFKTCNTLNLFVLIYFLHNINIADLIAGGTDTISMILSWIVAIICHHPEVQKCPSAEIDEFMKQNGRLPLFSGRKQLPYCVSVIKECMRCKPTTAFGIPHTLHIDSK
jgi:hypothetical protein